MPGIESGRSRRRRESSSDSRRRRRDRRRREKGWNKWPKKDEGRDSAKPDPKDKPPEGGEVFAAAPTAPEEDPYQVAVATKEEIDAAAAPRGRGLPRPFMAGGHTAGLG